MADPTDDTLYCRRCLRERTADELDRSLWCDDCVAAERRRAAWWGRGLALVAAALFALWIGLVIRPGSEFRILWGVLLIFAYYLLTRLARELTYGVVRVRDRPGAREEAVSAGDPAGGPAGRPVAERSADDPSARGR